MKRALALLGLALLLLAAVLIGRASLARSRQIATPPVNDIQLAEAGPTPSISRG